MRANMHTARSGESPQTPTNDCLIGFGLCQFCHAYAENKAVFDENGNNSESNPNNPNPSPVDIGWGEKTTDEMCIAFLGLLHESVRCHYGESAGSCSRGRHNRP